MIFFNKISIWSIILFMIAISSSLSAYDTHQSSLPIDMMTKYENFSFVKLSSFLYVSAYTERLQDGESRSIFFACRVDHAEKKVVFNQTIESAYNARIEVRSDMHYLDQPIIILRVQNGAIAETLEAFGIKNGELVLLQSLDSGSFDWCYERIIGKTLLVAIPGSPSDQTVYYSWNGASFEQVNSTTAK